MTEPWWFWVALGAFAVFVIAYVAFLCVWTNRALNDAQRRSARV